MDSDIYIQYYQQRINIFQIKIVIGNHNEIQTGVTVVKIFN